MEKAVYDEKPGENILEIITKSSIKARAVRKKLEELKNNMLARFADDKYLRNLVHNLFSTIDVPEPPDEETLTETAKELEHYANSIEELTETLTRIYSVLEELRDYIKLLEDRREQLEIWSQMIKLLDEHLYARLVGLSQKILRFLDSVSLEDPVKSLREAKDILGTIEKQVRICRSVYNSYLDKVLEEIYATIGVLKIASRVASIEKAGIINAYLRKLDRVEDSIRRLKVNPEPYQFKKLFADIASIRRVAEEIIGESMSSEEIKIMEEIARMSKALGGKNIKFDVAVDRISRITGIRVEEVISYIYTLSKRGILNLSIKLG